MLSDWVKKGRAVLKRLLETIRPLQGKARALYLDLKAKRDRTIGNQIAVSIVSVGLCCSIVIGLVGIICIVQVNAQSEKIYSENLVAMAPINTSETEVQTIRLDLSRMLLNAASNTQASVSYSSEINQLQSDISDQLSTYAKYLDTQQKKDNYNDITDDVDDYRNMILEVESDIHSGNIAEAIQYADKNDKIGLDLKNKVNTAFTLNIKEAKQRNSDSKKLFYVALAVIAAFAALFIFLAFRLSKYVAKGISTPIRKMAAAAESIADGDLDVDLEVETKDETGVLADSFRKIILSLGRMKKDIQMLIDGAIKGDLDVRADTSQHKGDYKAIVEGVNQMFDTIKEPLDVAAAFIDRMADGVLQEDLENTYPGYYAVLIANLNKVRTSIGNLSAEAEKLARAGVHGNLDVRGDETKFKGVYAEIIHGVNETFNAIKDPLDIASKFIGDLADGAAEKPIDNVYQGYYAELIDNVNRVMGSIQILVRESKMLAKAGTEGNLTVRSDPNLVSGQYAEIIHGMNDLLDAIAVPLTEAGQILKNISKENNFTQKMTGRYKGAFNEFSVSINRVMERLLDVEKIFVDVSTGDLSLLDAYKEKEKLSEFDRLTPAATTMMQNIHDMIEESSRLASAAVEGDLSQRGDEAKFQGGYQMVIEKLNQTVSAFVRPMQEASEVLQQVAKGDLTVEVAGQYSGEYNLMKNAITTALNAFNSVLSELNVAANQVSAGSRQVSDVSQSLSQGATQQASSVEELLSSMDEIVSKSKQNVQSAIQASKLSVTAQDQVKQGNEKMVQMLASMQEIKESSSDISKIIKLIDDVAFQTNILALNAAVEAAHAGQYGKGFAVVAEEVRNLAQKSAEAARDTDALIRRAIGKVEAGMQIADGTAEVLKNIEGSVGETVQLVQNIATLSDEQANSAAEIDKGISQVSAIVQTNSSIAEESAASSEELSGEAETLMELVKRFHLQETSAT